MLMPAEPSSASMVFFCAALSTVPLLSVMRAGSCAL
jgi:hypothetical protein